MTTSRPLLHRLRPARLALAACLCLPGLASAQSIWDGDTDGNWSTASNWDFAPTPGGALTFTGSGNPITINDLTIGFLVGGITFGNNTNPTTTAFTLGGNAITLGGDITTAAASSAAFNSLITDLITLDLILNGDRVITTNNASDDAHNLTIDGIISETGGSRGLTKSGGARLTLNGTNTYTGATTITDGVLVLGSAGAISASSPLTLAGTVNTGGVLGLGAGNFTRALGSGAGEVQWTGHGGFAAFGADRSVNLGGASATAQWAAGGFVPNGMSLVFGYGNGADSQDSTHTVDFQNPIDLNGGTRSIRVNDGNNGGALGSARIDAILSGGVSNSTGTGALTKDGAGVLSLMAASTYTGQTLVNDGVLVLNHANALPGGVGTTGGTSNLRLHGNSAVVALTAASGDFTRGLGTGVDQVQWTNGGGFAAYGADRIVNLGGASATVTWGSGNFVTGTGQLVLGDETADAIVDFQNPIDLGAANRTINGLGPSGVFTAKVSGALSGTGGLIKTATDAGLDLSAANSTFTGQLDIQGGVLRVTKLSDFGADSSIGHGTAGVPVLMGSSFRTGVLDYAGTGDSSDRTVRLGITTATNTQSGTIRSNGTGAILFTATHFNDTISGVTVARNLTLGGANTALNTISGIIQDNNTGGGGLINVVKADAGTWVLSGANTYTGLTTLSGGSLHLNNAAALGGGGGFTISASGTTIDNSSGGPVTLSSANVVTWSGSFAFGGSNDLSFANGTTLSTASRTITLNGTSKTLTFGTVSFTNANTTTVNEAGTGNKLVLGGVVLAENNQARTQTIAGSGAVDITGAVTDGPGSGADGLSYTGTGALRLLAASSYTGLTTLNNASGTLTLAASNTTSGVTLTAGNLNINHAGAIGSGTLTLTAGTIDNTSGGAITVSTANAVAWNGNFAFGGSNDLSLANGTASANGSRTITLHGTGRTLTFGTLSLINNRTTTVNDAGSGNKLVLGGIVLAELDTARTQIFNGSAPIDITGAVTDGPGTGADLLSYTGTSVLTLNGVNTHTGLTTLNNAAGTLNLNGASTMSGGVTLTAGTLNINNAGSGGTSSAIGTGTLTLTAGTIDNTTGGAITVSTPNVVVWGGNFAFGGTQDLSFANGTASMTTSRTITLNGTGKTLTFGTLTATTTTANLTVNDVGTGNKLVLGGLVLAELDQARTRTLSGSAPIDITGAVTDGPGTGADGLTFTGNNVLRLLAASSYTGATTVNTTGGTLRTTAAGSIGTGNLVVTQGNLELNHAAQSVGTVTLGATTATAPATIVMDAGTTFTLGGTLLYNDSTDNQAGTISGGTINLNGARTWTVDDSTGVDADLTVSSAVANSDGGAGTFTKNGLGRLVLNGNNTFANPLSVTDGILRIGHANALGSTAGATTVTSGEALELDGVGVTGETLNLNGVGFGGSTGALRNLSGTNSWTGTINLDGSARIHADAGTQLTVSAITAGGTSRNITFGGAGDLVASGKIGSGGANPVAQLIKAGTGLLTLSNTANDYTGGTVVNEGILRLGASDVIPNAGTVTVNASTGGTATLDLDDFSDTIAALTLGGTGGTATSVNQVLTGTGTLTLGGAVTVTATGDWTTAALISGKVDLGIASRTFSVNNSTGTDVDLHVDAPISGGAVGITKDLAGTMLLSGASTYGGTTTVRDGVLRLGINNALPATILTMDQRNGGTSTVDLGVFNATIGALTLSGGTTTVLGSLNQIIGSGVLTLGGAVTYNAGTASFHNGQATVSANVDLGAATRTFTINDSLATTTETVISGNISGTGAGLSKAGTGTLVLSGVNTYDGDTSISAGVLRAANNQAFGTTGTLSLANTDAVLELADGISVSRPTTVSNSGNNKVIRLLDGATTATFGGDITISETTAGNFDVSAETGGTLTLSGAIGGTGAAGLSKEGAGTVALSGANTFTGATTINAGTLQLGDGGTTGSLSTSSTITNNGTFSINRSNAVAQGTDFNGGGITGTGSLTQSGTGTTTLTAANTYTGTTTINAGTLQLGDGGTTGSLSTSSAITNNATFTINRSNTVVQGTDFSGTGISGSGNFVHAGTGTTTLSAANTYTGTTTVSAGKLVVTDAQALGTAAAGTTVASGASLELGTGLNYSTAESLTINGSGGSHGGALRGGSGPGTTTFAGAITAATDATIHSGGYILTLTGGIDKNGTVLTLTGGGTVNISGTGISGSDPDSDLVVDGTTVNLDVANTYNGPTYIRNGGVINANAANALPTASGRSNLILDDVGSGSSTLNLNSGIAQSVASLSGAASSGVALGTSNLTLGSASGSTTFAGTISGSTGGLIKDGASTQILAGANTYDGATTVSGGTLLLNGDQSAANGATTVASGATLGGTGTSGAVTTTIQSGGTLTGGTDGTISTLTFTDDLIAQSGSTWLVDIASGAADLIIANLIDLSGSPTLVVNDTGSWAAGQTWNIAQYTSSLSGMFASGATVVGSRGTTFTIDYSNGGFITLTSAVPEPSAVLVILFGLGALGFWRLRQGKGLAKAGDGIPAPARAED